MNSNRGSAHLLGNTSDVPKCVEKLLKMLWQLVEEKERNAKVEKESDADSPAEVVPANYVSAPLHASVCGAPLTASWT